MYARVATSSDGTLETIEKMVRIMAEREAARNAAPDGSYPVAVVKGRSDTRSAPPGRPEQAHAVAQTPVRS